MKTLTTLLLLVASIAGAETILVTTNLHNYGQISGVSNGNVYFATNVYIPPQTFIFQSGPITNANGLGVTNLVAELQLSIDSSNTNWVTLDTFYPSTTNATVDTVTTDFGKISLPLRVRLTTTNSLPAAVYRQETVRQ